jgi:hypothetical protein
MPRAVQGVGSGYGRAVFPIAWTSKEGPMDRADFWKRIDRAREESGGDVDETTELLQEQLTHLPDREILAFDRILWELMAESYRWDLWAAAYIINGGCSDDGFDDFRGWLIAQGQHVYDAALQNPDSLAVVAVAEVEHEPMLYVARLAYEEKTGNEMPAKLVDNYPRAPAGQPWQDNDSELERLLPRLWAKFGS